jgi:hypothetical protein
MPHVVTYEARHGRPERIIQEFIPDFCDWLGSGVREDHYLTFTLINTNAIQDPGSEKTCFGAFVWHDDARILQIFVAVNAHFLNHSERKADIDAMEGDRLRHVLFVAAHEFAHYEQLRDGKKIQERGVKVRAENLVNTFLDEALK